MPYTKVSQRLKQFLFKVF